MTRMIDLPCKVLSLLVQLVYALTALISNGSLTYSLLNHVGAARWWGILMLMTCTAEAAILLSRRYELLWPCALLAGILWLFLCVIFVTGQTFGPPLLMAPIFAGFSLYSTWATFVPLRRPSTWTK